MSVTERQILHNFTYMSYLKLVKPIETVEWWLPGAGREIESCSMDMKLQIPEMKKF